MGRQTWSALAGVLAVASAWPLHAAAAPPAARVDPVVDVYHGERIPDDYRWMESRPPEFNTWMKAQDDVTRSELKALPGYAKLAADVAALSAGIEVAIDVTIAGDRLFYTLRPRGATQRSLYVATLEGGSQRLLVDPLVAPLGAPDGAIGEFKPSPDGSKITVGVSRGGSEEMTLFVIDVATGQPLAEAIDRTRFASVSWDPTGDAFYYNRLNAFPPGAPQSDRFKDEVVYRHVLGTDADQDARVFATADVRTALGRDGFAGVMVPPGSEWSFAQVNSGVSPEGEWWIAPTASLSHPNVPWRKFAELSDKVGLNVIGGQPMVVGDGLYMLSFKDAPNWQLVRYDSPTSTRCRRAASPESKGVLTGAVRSKDGIYLVRSEGGVYTLSRYDPETGKAAAVAMPYPGAIREATADPSVAGVVYAIDGWTRQPQVVRHVPGVASMPLRLNKPFMKDLRPYVSEELSATAADGTAIPVSVVYRKGLRRDGRAPAIVEAYGAYGVSSDPMLSPRLLAWYDRGGVYAVVHVRGGGEYGEAWHLAGKGSAKPNTWRDFIAGVTLLQERGYTSKATAAGWGTSAGGIMIGRTITERPDLLRAAIVNVGMSDALRFETSEGGPANVAEFGTVADADGYRALREMSAYHHVSDGTRYPATLLTAGMNDHRVPAWEGAKMTARLQAAQAAGGPPIRLRVEFDAGHGMGSSKSQYDDFYTDMMAFVLNADQRAGFTATPTPTR